MLFTSFDFPIFAAVLLLLYYGLPRRWQWCLLLAASYGVYLDAGISYLGYLLFTTLSTYAATRIMAGNTAAHPRQTAKRRNRLWLCLCLAGNFGLLFFCKIRVLQGSLLPLGISFYCFQTMGYVIDVYRGTVAAERNLLRLALFTAFFPQLIQGPISKYSQLAPQLYAPHPFDRKQICFGLQRMLWGYFKKLVIADRIAPAVAALTAAECTGGPFLLLTLLYGIQIYGDFTGGIDIALGFCQALGISMGENFHRPFFSQSVAEYWRRWHISLGTWMKEYIFYPICVSGPMRRLSKAARNRFGSRGKRLPVYIASLATWSVTGIWHGLTPNFLLWGMMNCAAITLSEELEPIYARFRSFLPPRTKGWYKGFQILRTFWLMNLIRAADLFPDIGAYFRGLTSLLTGISGPLPAFGLTGADWGIVLAGCSLLLAVSLIQEKHGSIRELLWRHPLAGRAVTFLLFLTVLVLGCYGPGYDAGSFIYNQF